MSSPGKTARNAKPVARSEVDSEQPEPSGDATVSTAPQGETESTSNSVGPATGVRNKIPLKYLPAAALILSIAALCFGIAAQIASPPNSALVDPGTNSGLTGQVRGTIEKAFSYDPAKPADSENAAKQGLGGPAVGQYEQLYGQIKRIAREQNIVLGIRVQSAGVISLEGDRARLLVFADQSARRAGTDQHNAGPAQFEVAAQRSGNIWKITGITLF